MPSHAIIDLTACDVDDINSKGSPSSVPEGSTVIDLTVENDTDQNEEGQVQKRLREEERSVAKRQKTNRRRAKSLVESIIALLQTKQLSSQGIQHVDKNDAISQAEGFLECRSKFKQASKSTRVSLGYYFASQPTIEAKCGVVQHFSVQFGDGICTQTNPQAFPKRGTFGLMLAIVRGSEQDIRSDPKVPVSDLVDAIVVNRQGKHPCEDEIVVRESYQVLPLVKFNRQNIQNDTKLLDLLWSIHEEVQRNLDNRFNDSITRIERIRPPPRVEGPFGAISFVAPKTFAQKETSYRHVACPSGEDECCFCLDLLDSNVVQLNVCVHRFHEECLKGYLQQAENDGTSVESGVECPECRRPVKEPRGSSPSGTMHVSTKLRDCAGFPGCGSIGVSYCLPSSLQQSYHPAPNSAVRGLPVYGPAMIPNNHQGRQLLKRLEYSFGRGLSFEVAASPSGDFETRVAGDHATILASNCESWSNSTHWKRCNDELDVLNIPSANALEHGQGIKYKDV